MAMVCQVSVSHFVPTNRDQGCGQLLEQVPKAAPVMDLRDVLKHCAVSIRGVDALTYTGYKSSSI